MARKRNYTRERLNESKTRKEHRKARGRARTALGLKDGDPRIAGHKKPLSKGGTYAKSNTRVERSKTSSNKQGGKLQPRSAKARGGRAKTKKR